MQYRQLGKTDLKVSSIGYGTWGFANDEDWKGATKEESEKALLTALDGGVNFIDTARTYGDGLSEEWIGNILQNNPHKEIIISSKIYPMNQEWSGMKGTPIKEAFPKSHIISQVDASLKALHRDYLDLMYFHVWEDEWASETEWQETIRELTKQGKVRYWGISTNDYEANNCLKACETGLISAVMTIFNLFYQEPIQTLFPKAKEMGIGVVARVPLDEGGLSGKLTTSTTFPNGDFRQTYFSPQRLKQLVEHVQKLQPFIDQMETKTLPELALRFILSFDEVSAAIPGMRNAKHASANIQISDLPKLGSEMLQELSAHTWNRNFYD
jgi:aryl-alcohol dehydrogenase-like predicted oxidoreductase